MRELKIEELEQVSGGDGAGTGGTDPGTSVTGGDGKDGVGTMGSGGKDGGGMFGSGN